MSQEKTLTDANFKQEVLDQKGLILVDFWAEWCGPCKMLGPVIEKVAKANEGKLTVAKLNVDDHQETPQQYGIQGIPTMIFFKDGKNVQQLVGFQSQDAIQNVINDIQ